MSRFDGGWIKLYRSAIDSDIGSNPVCLAIFVRLLAWAVLKPTVVRFDGQPRELKRGSLVIGVRDLAERVGCARATVYRHLVYLEKRDTIRREVGTEGTLITVLNFDRYQGSDEVLKQKRDNNETLSERYLVNDLNPIEEVKKERSNLSKEQIEECAKIWKESLSYLGCERPIPPSEKTTIARAILSQDLDTVQRALLGFRYEPKKDGYDPADYAFVSRVLESSKIARFVSLAAKNQPKSRDVFEGDDAC